MSTRVVWKFPFANGNLFTHTFSMPKGAEVLTVQTQNAIPCLWAVVDPDAPLGNREFEIRATGEKFEKNSDRYVGTYQEDSLDTWHVFEVFEKPPMKSSGEGSL